MNHNKPPNTNKDRQKSKCNSNNMYRHEFLKVDLHFQNLQSKGPNRDEFGLYKLLWTPFSHDGWNSFITFS
jgi:hypothetical protein